MVRADLGAEGGKVRLIWLGRDHIAGIEPGRVLAVEGTVSVQRGRATIYNPRYELRPDGGGQQDCLRPDGGGQQDC